jgi:putative peptidoglycan lipid II flippase
MEVVRVMMRQAARFGSGTLLSRFAGMTRDILMAATLGSGEHVAAFFMAFRFSNLMRRILGEGAMQAALVPVFEELRHKSEREAALFFRSTWIAVSCVLLTMILLAEALLGLSLFFVEQPQLVQVIRLTMAMMPGLLFICWYGIQAALCTCYGSFFVPAAAPAAFNLIWIAGLAWATGWVPDQAVLFLAGTIVFAYGLQWMAVTPETWRTLRRAIGQGWWRAPLGNFAPLKALIRPLTLGLVGVSATQINSLIDAIFARIADPSGPAYLWYAVRIEQVPVGMVGVALSSAALPALARCLMNGQNSTFVELVRVSFVRSGQTLLAFSAIFLVLGFSLIELVFCRGAFCRAAAGETTLCLWAYALGLLPQTWVILLTPVYYAAQNYRRPSVGAIWALGSNLAMNAFLVFGLGLGATSIALSTGIASLVNLWWLVRPFPSLLGARALVPILRFGCALLPGILAAFLVGFVMEDASLSLMLGEIPSGQGASLLWKVTRLACEGSALLGGFLISGGYQLWKEGLELEQEAPVPLPT